MYVKPVTVIEFCAQPIATMWRPHLEAELERTLNVATRIIAELDRRDGDPDLEPEPWEGDADFEPGEP